MQNWIVELKGDEEELQRLSDGLNDQMVSIEKISGGNGLQLISDNFKNFFNIQEQRKNRETLLETILGVANLYGFNCHGISIKNITKYDVAQKHGEGTEFFDGKIKIIRTKVTRFSISKIPSSNKSVEMALKILAERQLDWVEMYKLWEIVESDIGKKNMIERGWVSSNKISLFKRTANSMAVTGIDSRHGPSKENPPPKPMKIEEARDWIGKLLAEWLKKKQDY